MQHIQPSVTAADAGAMVFHSPQPRLPERGDRGLAADRNRASAEKALAQRFPVIRRLIGEASFRRVSQRFILDEPPAMPLERAFGDNFPRFLRTFGHEASIEYVADIAELEMARGRALDAARVLPLGRHALSAVSAPRLMGMRCVLHPSVSLIQSRFPVVTIWESNLSAVGGMIYRWSAEAAVVARPFRAVEVRRLPPGGHAFLRTLSRGETFAMAAEIGAEAASGFELAVGLRLLRAANLVVGIHDER